MGFQLVLKLVTLSDVEPHKGCSFALLHLIWCLIMPQWLKLDPYCHRQKCIAENLLFGNI